MAVKVRISYEKPQELRAVAELLKPMIKSCKAGKGKDGRYKKAYMDLETPEEKVQKSANLPLI